MTPLALILAVAVVLPAAAEGDDEAARELASQRETAAEIQRRLEIYLKNAPHPVDDVLASRGGKVAVSFRCPETPLGEQDPRLNAGKRALPEQDVVITVQTAVAGWDAAVAQDGDRAGFYQWNFEGVGWDADGRRDPLHITNKLMLNPERIEPRSLRHHVENVKTYYHELLHGQLMIDAMKSDRGWQDLYCKLDKTPKEVTEFFAPLDPNHLRITPLEDEFGRWLWDEVVRRTDAADDDPWRPYPKKEEDKEDEAE